MKFNIRLLYLYLFSFVGLLTVIIGSVQLVDLALETYVFKVEQPAYYAAPLRDGEAAVSKEEQDEMRKQEQANQRKRQVSNSLAMLAVGFPVYFYHWKTISREKK